MGSTQNYVCLLILLFVAGMAFKFSGRRIRASAAAAAARYVTVTLLLCVTLEL